MKKYKFKLKTKTYRMAKILGRVALLAKKNRNFEVVNLNDHELPARCILIGNHSGASGPSNYIRNLKHKFMTWVAYQPCYGYLTRWRFFYHTFYRKKLKYGKFKAWLAATIFSMINPMLYKHVGPIPVYYDRRIANTFKYSMTALENDLSILLFPENSDEGYKATIETFWHGYLQLSKLYYKRHKVDLPIYTLRYEKGYKKIVIGKPIYYNELIAQGFTDEQINQKFVDYINELRAEIIPPTQDELAEAAAKEYVDSVDSASEQTELDNMVAQEATKTVEDNALEATESADDNIIEFSQESQPNADFADNAMQEAAATLAD